jgi:IS4 transposase
MLLMRVLEHLIKRAPLPMMARLLLERSLDAAHINALFEQIASEQYTRLLLFSDIVALMCMVVTRMQRSIKAAYDTYQDVLPSISYVALYDKLKHVEPATMTALIHENAVRLGEVISELKAELPALIRGYRTRIVDGNALAATDHRLKELRKTASAPLPGKSLVVFDYERDITTETIPCEDGHAQERALFGKLLNLVRKGEVWIADRNFCTKKFLEGIVKRGAHFIIRQHAGLRVCFLSKLTLVGACDNGKVFEQKVRIGADPKGIIVRRIVVKLRSKNRDGDLLIGILTSLPPEIITALSVAEAYRKRWRLETMFRELTLALRCEVKGLGAPRAALFVFTIALLAANILATIRAAIRAAHGNEAAENVSSYGLVNDLESTFRITEFFAQTDNDLPGRSHADVHAVDMPLVANDCKTDISSPSPQPFTDENGGASCRDHKQRDASSIVENKPALKNTSDDQLFGMDWRKLALLPLMEFVALVLRCAKNLKLHRYPKAPTRSRKLQTLKPKRVRSKYKPHVSTDRLLNPARYALAAPS